MKNEFNQTGMDFVYYQFLAMAGGREQGPGVAKLFSINGIRWK